jgi:hypothetical protein
VTRFLVSLRDGLLRIAREGPPRAVTLRDGSTAEARDLIPVPVPPAQPAAGAPLARSDPRTDLPE